MINSKIFKSDLFVSIVLFVCILVNTTTVYAKSQTVSPKRWVGTWSSAPYAAGNNTPPSPFLANNTLRQIVRVSIGGDTLRVKFSNVTGTSAVTINAVNIAVSPDGTKSAIDASTVKQLKFNGNASVTMAAGATATSDVVAFPLKPDTRLAITIYYGDCQTNASMTHHYGSRTNSYILIGDQTSNAAFTGATTVERWYTINTIDVWAETPKAAIAVLGNSITDGYGLNGGLQNRWTDIFSQRLLNNSATAHLGVLNLGIGGTYLTTSGAGRYKQDILNQSGLRYIIIFYGVNDIGGNVSAANIINTFKKMIKDAHAQNIRIYGATITPFGGNGYYSEAHEATRSEVNKWIRTPGNFDKCIDFDKAIRNPADTTKMLSTYNNDGLHPSVAGYRFLGESVDLDLFTASDTIFPNEFKAVNDSQYLEAKRFVTSKAVTNLNVVSNASTLNQLRLPDDRLPENVGKRLVANLLARHGFYMLNSKDNIVKSVHYAEACTGFGAARFAGLLRDSTAIQALSKRYSRVLDENIYNSQNHVDVNVYGILPLELFIQNVSQHKFLNQGIELADSQWENPLPNGLSNQTRFWIDDMWMIGSLQIQAYRATGKSIYLERAALELNEYVLKLQQPNGLFFHGPNAHFYWGRGNGWVAAALAEIVSELPKSNPHYKTLHNAYLKMMKSLLKFQAKDGMWRQLIDYPEAWKETSSTAMFGYAMTIGVKKGLLPAKRYKKASLKAWTALSNYVNPQGEVTDVCVGTGQSKEANFYLTRPKTTGDLHGQAAVLWFAYSMLL